MTLHLDLSPELESKLSAEAARQGLSLQELVLRVLEERPVRADESVDAKNEFAKTAEYVMKKNTDLYRRLA